MGGGALDAVPLLHCCSYPRPRCAVLDGSSVAWHYDSVPFVCVVMLSDCTDMVGGETALRMPSGVTMKVRGPSTVSALGYLRYTN